MCIRDSSSIARSKASSQRQGSVGSGGGGIGDGGGLGLGMMGSTSQSASRMLSPTTRTGAGPLPSGGSRRASALKGAATSGSGSGSDSITPTRSRLRPHSSNNLAVSFEESGRRANPFATTDDGAVGGCGPPIPEFDSSIASSYLTGLDGTTTSGRQHPVSYTHLRAHETPEHLVCRLLLEKKKKNT
eukprot:TRINITY_DN6065_c0_g1_i2.p1 TRINITY_DN6065_c0_g1~~TRINITY_DN6065_c0_g1_i2.p1  ORF type:complete len:187 (-),score=55.87 TRINITY_DN6065_c0_g1_i2:115-675(-)